MIVIDEQSTIGNVLFSAADKYGDSPLLIAPRNPTRDYYPEGRSFSYSEAATVVRILADRYRDAGYGFPHFVGLHVGNRPEHMLHKLAMNSIGVCCVPINPDYRTGELVYLVEHARLDLIVVSADQLDTVNQALQESEHRPAVVVLDDFMDSLPAAPRARTGVTPASDTPASILYTSGTTGRPKGCVLSHRYELAAGDWYARQGGLVSIRPQQERLYNPLPLFHVNSSILSFWCMLLTGNCQIQPQRFQVSRWWEEIRENDATIVHYLGVIIPMLLKQPESELDRAHKVRLGYGAGVEPQLHAQFEERFGFPLVELWGMTEMVRTLTDNMPPRKVGTRAFGKAVPGLDVQVVDADDKPVPDGTPGEMVIRHSAETPRKDFFSGYLHNEEATEEAWRGGWFHTGDVVIRAPEDGMLHFVDRDKNIIRRAGENIAAAEVEALLLLHPKVRQTAVMAAPDEIREAEVLACIV
ncbi:MAG TPA: AMP-binding protein, partial [Burkholderiaceae bacterium]|nr:AMP-binding protein [Burkholderiaceae bacterium]